MLCWFEQTVLACTTSLPQCGTQDLATVQVKATDPKAKAATSKDKAVAPLFLSTALDTVVLQSSD